MKTRKQTDRFVALETGNYYGRIIICPKGKSIDKDGFISKSHEINFRAGQKVRVRFPTGQEETVSVRMIPRAIPYGEQGHPPVDIYTDIPHVNCNVYGVKVAVPLASLEVAETDIQ